MGTLLNNAITQCIFGASLNKDITQ